MTTNYKAIIQLAAIVTEVRMIGSAQCNLSTFIIIFFKLKLINIFNKII